MTRSKAFLFILILLIAFAILPGYAATRYTPHTGDYFSYHEVIDLNNGQGDFEGYSEHQVIDGTERMNTVYGNGTVAAHFSYTWSFSNSSGSQTSGSSLGNFTYSSVNFHYEQGTDNQTGYSNPYTWFYIDNTLPNGATFWLLNAQMTISSTDATYHLTQQNKYVHAISAQGSSSYNRDDVYGRYTATYTWTLYFDPATGYVIGYDYVEHDVGTDTFGYLARFDWTDNLQVSSTSYPLASAPVPIGDLLLQNAGLIIGLVLLVVFLIVVYLIVRAVQRRMRHLREHPSHQMPYGIPQYNPPAPAQQQGQSIDLTPKQQPPVQQIVVKEVVKVKCRYCGALIDGTVQQCPFCGAPRT